MTKIQAQSRNTSVRGGGGGRLVRKDAPVDIELIEEAYKDERKELVAWAKEKMGEKAKGKHFCFQAGHVNPAVWQRKGYEAVVIETKPIEHGGDPLTVIDERIPRRQIEAAAQLSWQQCQDAMNGTDPRYAAVDADGKVHAPEPVGE
jgi:hypothetical protein